MSLIDLQMKYVKLHDEIQEAEKKLKDLKAEKLRVESFLVEMMRSIGQNSTQIDGRRLTIREGTSVRKRAGVPMEALADAMRRAGITELVKDSVHPQSLSAWGRDVLESGGEFPNELAELLDVYKYTNVAVTAL